MAVERSQKRPVVIGAAIVVTLLAITLVVLFTPDIFRKLTPSFEIIAVTDEAGALERMSPVWIAGREVGTVVSVEMRPAYVDSLERIAIRLSIPEKYRSHVRADSDIRITKERLIGSPIVDIIPGSLAAPPIGEGDTLRIRESGSLEGLLNRTFILNASMAQLVADMRAIQLVTGEARERELQRLNRSLSATAAEFRELTTTLRDAPINTFGDPEFKRLFESISTRSEQLSRALGAAAARARRAQNQARPSLERLAARSDTIRAVLADIQGRIDASGGGLLIRAQKDSAIVRGLHEAQVQLDSLIAETKRNPLRFWFF